MTNDELALPARLGIAGEIGVRKGISLLRDEVSRNMAMLGVTTTSDMRRDFLLQ